MVSRLKKMINNTIHPSAVIVENTQIAIRTQFNEREKIIEPDISKKLIEPCIYDIL